jgi:hypothetical protein
VRPRGPGNEDGAEYKVRRLNQLTRNYKTTVARINRCDIGSNIAEFFMCRIEYNA